MPSIDIHGGTFQRLQNHAKPLVDSADAVINRALDALERLGDTELKPPSGNERRIDPRSVPNLTHTKVLAASISGDAIERPNWNGLLDEMLRRAVRQLGSFEKVRRLCPVNLIEGRKEDDGYGYLEDIKISVQGQDANAACRAIIAAAQGLGIAVEIALMWRPKKGAAYPGERARLTVPVCANEAGLR